LDFKPRLKKIYHFPFQNSFNIVCGLNNIGHTSHNEPLKTLKCQNPQNAQLTLPFPLSPQKAKKMVSLMHSISLHWMHRNIIPNYVHHHFWCRLMAKAWIFNAMLSLILNFGLVNTNVVCANVNNHITCHVKSYPSFHNCAFYKTYLGICINTCIACVHINFEHMHTMMCVFFSLSKHKLWCNTFLI
jgi:hypothetical protein